MEPETYQQLMFDLLGNRDYDSFENNELDSLKNKIGYALYGHPQQENGYSSEENQLIDKLFDIILTQSNVFSKHKNRVVISFVYNCAVPLENEKKRRALKFSDYNPNIDMQPYPVFILRKCKYSPNSCRVVIDQFGRVYQSWEEYLRRNTLPKCLMIYPKNGRYSGDETGKVILETSKSPSRRIRAKILNTIDVASTGIGIGSAGIALAASIPAITFVGPAAACGAGMAGIGVGIYSVGRSIGTLYDKSRHMESLSFSDTLARAAFLNIIAGAMGFVGAGANVAISQLASQGTNIGREAVILATTINAANVGVSGLSVLNSGYDVLQPWMSEGKNPSLLSLVQLSSSVLFFGNALYNFRSARALIDETQTKVLKEIQKGLKNNKHRKVFKKLHMKTIEKHNGQLQKGNAEVIATMRKIVDKNQLFDLLSTSKKDGLDSNYIANNGGITTFSGVKIDLSVVNGLSHGNFENFFSNSASTDIITPSNINEIKNNIKKSFEILGLEGSGISKVSNYFVATMGCVTNIGINILRFAKEFIEEYIIQEKSILKALDELFPHSEEKSLQIINAVTRFIYEEAKKLETTFETSDSLDHNIFKTVFDYVRENHLNENERLNYFMKFICETHTGKGEISQKNLEQLKKYFASFMTERMLLYREKENRKANRQNFKREVERMQCQMCFGLYYNVISDS